MQTWVILIANLPCTIMQHKLKRHCSFSNLVTMARLMLMYYVDFIAFIEKPEKDWEYILQKANYEPPNVEPVLELVFD